MGLEEKVGRSLKILERDKEDSKAKPFLDDANSKPSDEESIQKCGSIER